MTPLRIKNIEREGDVEDGHDGPTINGIALVLAWAGMVISLVLSFGAGTTYFNPDDELRNVFGDGTIRYLGIIQLLLNIFLFWFYFLLRYIFITTKLKV